MVLKKLLCTVMEKEHCMHFLLSVPIVDALFVGMHSNIRGIVLVMVPVLMRSKDR